MINQVRPVQINKILNDQDIQEVVGGFEVAKVVSNIVERVIVYVSLAGVVVVGLSLGKRKLLPNMDFTTAVGKILEDRDETEKQGKGVWKVLASEGGTVRQTLSSIGNRVFNWVAVPQKISESEEIKDLSLIHI